MAKLTRHLVAGAAMIALTAMLGACSSGNGDRREMSGNGDDARSGRTVEMTSSHQFSPREVTVRVGETVTWKNTADEVHTVTADPSRAKRRENVSLPPGARPFDSGDIAPGKTYRYTFTTPGTYRYVCRPHEDKGMTGTVIVKPGGAGSPNPY